MAHTPGPWSNDHSHPEWERNVVWAGDLVVAHVVDDQHDDADANAHLIAAAPELLAALKMWMELETTCDGRRPCYCDDPEIAKHGKCYACMATDAIAKAEGVTTEGTNGKERSLD